MKTYTVLSERLVKSRAAYLGKSLMDVNIETGLGNGYIYRLWNRSNVTLKTIDRIAKALDCSFFDLVEDVEKEMPLDEETV